MNRKYKTAKADYKVLKAMSKILPKKKTRKALRVLAKSGKSSPVGAMSWNLSPFPREFRTQMTYSDTVTVSATTGVPTTYLYSVNGLYDCNITGTGTQPRFFDTLCGATNGSAPYYNYRVHASKITIEVFPKGSDSMGMRAFAGVGIFNTTTTGAASLSEMRMRADYKSIPVGYWYADKIPKLTRYCKLQNLFDIKDVKDDDGLVGDYTANPSKQGRYGITICPIDESSSRDYTVNVKITYYVDFFNRNDVADS